MQRVRLLFWINSYIVTIIIIVASITFVTILQRPSLSSVRSLSIFARSNRYNSGVGKVRNLERYFGYRTFCQKRNVCIDGTGFSTNVSNTSSSLSSNLLNRRNKLIPTNEEEERTMTRQQQYPSLEDSLGMVSAINNSNNNNATIIDTVSETLCGLLGVGMSEERITKQTMIDALHILKTAGFGGGGEPSTSAPGTTMSGGWKTNSISSSQVVGECADGVEQLLQDLSISATLAANKLCQISSSLSSTIHKKKHTWQALQDATEIFHSRYHNNNNNNAENNWATPRNGGKATATATAVLMMSESNALAVSLVFGALALWPAGGTDGPSFKAAASALSSTTSRNKPLRHVGRPLASYLARTYLTHACNSDAFQLQILNHFAKAFKLGDDCIDPMLTARVIRYAIRLGLDDESTSLMMNNSSIDIDVPDDDNDSDPQKQRVSGALALACQLQPWSVLSPVGLVDAAVSFDLWHTAEDICRSAHKGGQSSSASSSPSTPSGGLLDTFSTSQQEDNTRTAVERLIDVALEDRMVRRADSLATNLFDMGGQSRYVEARFYHACQTISKVITRRQMPIIDRQIERVDKAVAKVAGGTTTREVPIDATSASDATVMPNCTEREVDSDDGPSSRLIFDPSIEIRKFALEKLDEAGEITAAQRLASLYGMDYVHDDQAVLAAATLRRQKYLQYDDLLRGSLPTLISHPDDLRSGFVGLLQSPHRHGPFGFDAEWDDETSGAAVLQLANSNTALLIDIPALSSTEEGMKALEETVGKLFACSDSVVAGFACRQDLSRLRASSIAGTRSGNNNKDRNHWMSGTKAVVDVQNLVGRAEPKLFKAGLSRVCQFYFGKPLDKAEQCSVWSARPLSDSQRAYAALDAWVCIGIYNRVGPSANNKTG